MDDAFTQKMLGISERLVSDIAAFYKKHAVEAHVFGSVARETNDALSDIDIWITFDDDAIARAIEDRHQTYAQFGEIVLIHELQHNFPLNGIQSAVLYTIDEELIRVDYYLSPLSTARVPADARILFEEKKVEIGAFVPETKRTPRDLADRVTFFISLCFIAIKKVVRKDVDFMPFLISEFKKFEKDLPELSRIQPNSTFETIYTALAVLESVSNAEQKRAIGEIRSFLTRVEANLIASF